MPEIVEAELLLQSGIWAAIAGVMPPVLFASCSPGCCRWSWRRQPAGDQSRCVVGGLHAATDRLYPQVPRLPPASAPVRAPQRFASHVKARARLDAQRQDPVTFVRHAADTSLHTCAWSLADGLRGYLWLGMHTTGWAEVLPAVERIGMLMERDESAAPRRSSASPVAARSDPGPR
ncbi:hypothetical protein Cs7R123_06800 [Catellatospora sp. TT07R-123]|uniref:hypothetical protein n=1 Tax=Catellatospora sp. TT07R-123 TaxID=2733863 RepID=UPI001B2C3515|nr:hypothetical protein [Catellatospora sp. TT07R-123]GHJ43338.1 hypothetical protein Cs7R123_06800 [Catellatospora sp. TT07R-123]